MLKKRKDVRVQYLKISLSSRALFPRNNVESIFIKTYIIRESANVIIRQTHFCRNKKFKKRGAQHSKEEMHA